MADTAPQGGRPPMTVAAQNQPPPVDPGMAALNDAWGASQNQGGQRIFDRLGEVNGGVPQADWTQGIQRPEQQMQGGRPDMVVAAQNQPNQGMADLNAAWADSQPDPSGGLRNRFAQTMDKTGDLSQPLGDVPSINGDIAQGPAGADWTQGIERPDTNWTQGIERPDTNWIQGIQPPAASGGKWGQTIESLTGGNIRGELGGITGKQAGIGAGVGLGALALAYGLKRRKQKKENKSRMAERSKISDAAAQGQYLQGSPGNYGNSGNF
jgi:hypothetical protein